MATFPNSDEQHCLIEEAVLASDGKDWQCVADIWLPTLKTFRLDLEPKGRDDSQSIFLQLGSDDFSGKQWMATYRKGYAKWNSAGQHGEIRRDFAVDNAGDDPITSPWVSTDDPLIDKAHEIASAAQTQPPIGQQSH